MADKQPYAVGMEPISPLPPIDAGSLKPIWLENDKKIGGKRDVLVIPKQRCAEIFCFFSLGKVGKAKCKMQRALAR
jgi:hypothetical protein